MGGVLPVQGAEAEAGRLCGHSEQAVSASEKTVSEIDTEARSARYILLSQHSGASPELNFWETLYIGVWIYCNATALSCSPDRWICMTEFTDNGDKQ
jgi:hypothetical protein